MPRSGCSRALKRLRGTSLDPFGYTAERRMERALIALVRRADRGHPRGGSTAADSTTSSALAKAPMEIRGFGPVKEAAIRKARAEVERLSSRLDADPPAPRPAETRPLPLSA